MTHSGRSDSVLHTLQTDCQPDSSLFRPYSGLFAALVLFQLSEIVCILQPSKSHCSIRLPCLFVQGISLTFQ